MNDFAHWSIGCKPSLPRSCSCWQLLADPNLVLGDICLYHIWVQTFATKCLDPISMQTFICLDPILVRTFAWRHLGADICLEENCLDPISKQTFAWNTSWRDICLDLILVQTFA